MTNRAPKARNARQFHVPEMVYYGTDDGWQDGSGGELEQFRQHHAAAGPERTRDIHLVSVVGGLYGLNMIPVWRPTQITFFDINPHAIRYFELVRRVWTSSDSGPQFLARLANGDYDIEPEDELIRANLVLKQRDELPRSRGSSKRSLEHSWHAALAEFDLTRGLLRDVPVQVHCESMVSESFGARFRECRDTWFYCSNVVEFVFFDLHFANPINVVMLAIIFPGQSDLLDLHPFAGGPVDVHVEIPMRVSKPAS